MNGGIQQTFSAACLALGLIADDQEWTRAMEEATLWMMPVRLRQLFVRILIHCQPLHPEELWNKFKDAMSEDFSRTHNTITSYQKAYSHINSLLNNEGRHLAHFPTMEQEVEEYNLLQNEKTPGRQMIELDEQQYTQLNNQQKIIVDRVLHAAAGDRFDGNNCIYIDSPGGSGNFYI